MSDYDSIIKETESALLQAIQSGDDLVKNNIRSMLKRVLVSMGDQPQNDIDLLLSETMTAVFDNIKSRISQDTSVRTRK